MKTSDNYTLNTLRNDITQHNLQIKAIIQDITGCTSSLAELQALNSAGLSKISTLRKFIDKLSDIAKEERNPDLLKDVVSYREQMSSTMDSFKKANMRSLLTIEMNAKEELLKPSTTANKDTTIRNRHKSDKQNLVKVSSNVTDRLLSVSRQLAETTKHSADTLDTLVTTSDTITGTEEELKMTSGAINKSGKLLAKYGRREFTDKILVLFAFAFFVACVVYIVHKRLF